MRMRPIGLNLGLALILGVAGLLVSMALQNLTSVQHKALDDLTWARHKAEVAQTAALLAMDLTHHRPQAGAGPDQRPATPPERLRQRLETLMLQMAHWPVDEAQARLMAAVQASARRHLDLTLPAKGTAGLTPVHDLARGPADGVMASRALLLDALAALAEEQQFQVARAGASAQAAQRSSLLLLLGAAGLLLLLGLGLAWRATHAPTSASRARQAWVPSGTGWQDPAAPLAGPPADAARLAGDATPLPARAEVAVAFPHRAAWTAPQGEGTRGG